MSSAGLEAVELAASAGLVLDDWEAEALVDALAERGDGRWAAFEVGVIVPRQNGKGSILEARELAGLFLFGEELILHSAHEFKTAAEAFRRVLGLVQGCDDLERRVTRVRTSHGDEGIELRGGQRLRFVARSTGSGRGFSGDTVILDESYNLTPEAMSALLPTMATRPNPQLWYTSSAPLPDEKSDVLRALCRRGRKGSSSLAYMEFCADDPAEVSSERPWGDLEDRGRWAQANPSFGIRISEEFIERERAALTDESFARERLGLWRDIGLGSVIDATQWAVCEDSKSKRVGTVAFAVDVSPDRSSSAIGVAGLRADGKRHVEVVQTGSGTSWVVRRIVELVGSWKPCAVVVDPGSAAGSLLTALTEAGVEPMLTTSREVGQACGLFYDMAVQGGLRHLGQESLSSALMGAKKRPLGDAWAWNRKGDAEITPLVAVTLALWGFTVKQSEVRDPLDSVW